MRRQSLVLLAASLCVGLGLGAASSRGWRDGSNVKQGDAAYRDGAYQAQIDIESGRKAHLSSGRWSTDQDRASFIAGYQKNYRALAEKRLGKVEPTAAELAGYRDGMLDGVRHRRAAQPFQVSKTDNYRKAGASAESNMNSEAYRRCYRDAYSNGYQEGYYLPQESAELSTMSQK